MADLIKTILEDKTLDDLVEDSAGEVSPPPELTAEKIELALKCLKWQCKCTETEGNEAFIGLGDKQITKLAGISLDQLDSIKAERDSTISNLRSFEVIK